MSEIPPVPRPKSRKNPLVIILVVIGVLVVLGAATVIIFAPMIGRRIVNKTQEVRTRAVMKDVQVALGHYRTEYNQWPQDPALDASESVPARVQGAVLEHLLGKNARGIKFIDDTPAKPGYPGLVMEDAGEGKVTAMVDSWGNILYLMVDANLDSRVPNPKNLAGAAVDPGKQDPHAEFIPAAAVLFSAGPDGDPKTWKDNIASWMK